MMRKTQKLAAGIAAAMMMSAVCAPVSFAADNAFGIDEINWTDKDWASIAMTNDDTVDTGAVIRTEADPGSEAAGYLYRGAAAQVVEKGEEWTKIRSGRVTGFVKNEFLAYGDEARGLAAHYGKQGIIANWNDVNVFSANDADSQITAQLTDGTPMSMIEDNGHWITVQHGADSAGFVSEEDVTRVLLVDTAVPANGDDDENVPATMTAADVPAAPAEKPAADDQEYAASYAEADASYAEASYAEASYAEADDSWLSAATESYAEPASDGEYYEDSQDYSQDDSSNDYVSSQTVSDNAQIQALYDAYISAQNAAMDCTSEEDAQTKANAAIAAWNAYLEACGETSGTVAPIETTSSDDYVPAAEETYDDTTYEEAYYDDTSSYEEAYYDDETSTYVEGYSDDSSYSESAQTEAPAAETSSSSGSNAYGNYSDLDLLAAIIWCEAGNQSYDGMVAVGQVVMNRVASSSFPNTISEVLNQPGQFHPASGGTLQAALASGVNDTCYSAASDAMAGAAPVPGFPLYFNTHSGSYQLGAHYFS